MAIPLKGYAAAYELLCRDLDEVLEFVEPVDANANVFSHRIYSILLRACTEFEAICKDALVDQGYGKAPSDMNVYDYRTLEATLQLEPISVAFVTWQSGPLRMAPFSDWSRNQPPLAWYKSYNVVKHNRHSEFAKANLLTTVESVAALFSLIAKLSNHNWSRASWTRENGSYSFLRHPFCAYGPIK